MYMYLKEKAVCDKRPMLACGVSVTGSGTVGFSDSGELQHCGMECIVSEGCFLVLVMNRCCL